MHGAHAASCVSRHVEELADVRLRVGSHQEELPTRVVRGKLHKGLDAALACHGVERLPKRALRLALRAVATLLEAPTPLHVVLLLDLVVRSRLSQPTLLVLQRPLRGGLLLPQRRQVRLDATRVVHDPLQHLVAQVEDPQVVVRWLGRQLHRVVDALGVHLGLVDAQLALRLLQVAHVPVELEVVVLHVLLQRLYLRLLDLHALLDLLHVDPEAGDALQSGLQVLIRGLQRLLLGRLVRLQRRGRRLQLRQLLFQRRQLPTVVGPDLLERLAALFVAAAVVRRLQVVDLVLQVGFQARALAEDTRFAGADRFHFAALLVQPRGALRPLLRERRHKLHQGALPLRAAALELLLPRRPVGLALLCVAHVRVREGVLVVARRQVQRAVHAPPAVQARHRVGHCDLVIFLAEQLLQPLIVAADDRAADVACVREDVEQSRRDVFHCEAAVDGLGVRRLRQLALRVLHQVRPREDVALHDLGVAAAAAVLHQHAFQRSPVLLRGDEPRVQHVAEVVFHDRQHLRARHVAAHQQVLPDGPNGRVREESAQTHAGDVVEHLAHVVSVERVAERLGTLRPTPGNGQRSVLALLLIEVAPCRPELRVNLRYRALHV
ncbi:ABC transporter ATP-binding protein [Babesia caballi]|uniref:ABC transporter ATP-binding protein n=1 Tax=Babesia caballi TaxID=5871 RepID=A0AAV4M1P7_BABCB|nr:ABC transporter ATP-binding protein [Babesia caballi]